MYTHNYNKKNLVFIKQNYNYIKKKFFTTQLLKKKFLSAKYKNDKRSLKFIIK